ncbi:MAG: Hsp70 family protein, partial [Planctomycetaceae bacterium]
RASLVCQHAGQRQTYQIEQQQFERLTRKLLERTTDITKRLLNDNKMGWAHVDVVLTTGGSSRMPMIRNRLKQLSGTTLNSALSPDQSIAHGATYYAGMLLSNKKFAKSILNTEATQRLSQIKQHSVTARGLGVLIRDMKTRNKVPHYLIPANTSLPASETHTFGTVVANQKRVHLQIVESSTSEQKPPVRLGGCVIEDLPANLPEGSEIAVTIQYDRQARVQVSARDVTSGKAASTEILRQENLVNQLESDPSANTDLAYVRTAQDDTPPKKRRGTKAAAKALPSSQSPNSNRQEKQPAKSAEQKRQTLKPRPIPTQKQLRKELEQAAQPVPLCNDCGEPLDLRGHCPACGPTLRVETPRKRPAKSRKKPQPHAGAQNVKRQKAPAARRPKVPLPPPPADDEILELGESGSSDHSATKRPNLKRGPRKNKPSAAESPSAQQPVVKKKKRAPAQPPKTRRKGGSAHDSGEDEFWQLVD